MIPSPVQPSAHSGVAFEDVGEYFLSIRTFLPKPPVASTMPSLALTLYSLLPFLIMTVSTTPAEFFSSLITGFSVSILTPSLSHSVR